MTANSATRAEVPAQLSLQDRRKILANVLAALQKRFYSPEKLNGDWQAAVDRHRSLIEEASTADSFEQSISDLLAELQTSHLGFFHSQLDCAIGSLRKVTHVRAS
jgi:carboxyl-terminal processing protease